jgi:hypothetical protein
MASLRLDGPFQRPKKFYIDTAGVLAPLATFAGGLTLTTQLVIQCPKSRLQALLALASQFFLASPLGCVIIYILLFGFQDGDKIRGRRRTFVAAQLFIVGIFLMIAFMLLSVAIMVAGNTVVGINGIILLGLVVIGCIISAGSVYWLGLEPICICQARAGGAGASQSCACQAGEQCACQKRICQALAHEPCAGQPCACQPGPGHSGPGQPCLCQPARGQPGTVQSGALQPCACHPPFTRWQMRWGSFKRFWKMITEEEREDKDLSAYPASILLVVFVFEIVEAFVLLGFGATAADRAPIQWGCNNATAGA